MLDVAETTEDVEIFERQLGLANVFEINKTLITEDDDKAALVTNVINRIYG
jgi:hypothetical protein